MRNRYKIGIPLAAGLATGGYALSQGEDPGSAALASIAGGLGGAAGLLGARKLAGKYAEPLREAAQTHLTGTKENPVGLGALLSRARSSIPADRRSGLRAKLVEGAANKTADILTGATDPRGLGKILAAGAVPAGALTAGLGGVALGAIPGSMGIPGFNQENVPVQPTTIGAVIGGTAGTALGGIPGAVIGGSGGAVIGSLFDQNVITDPELAGSSNTQMARMSTPTLRYIG